MEKVASKQPSKWLVYPGPKEDMTWENTQQGGFLTYGFTEVLKENQYDTVSGRLLNESMSKAIGKHLNLAIYPMKPNVDCINVDLDDNIKQGIRKVDLLMVMAIHPPDGKNDLIGLSKEVKMVFETIVPMCKVERKIVVITNDQNVKMIATLMSGSKATILDPSKDTILQELKGIEENKGGSMLITMCHGDRVKDKKEEDGFSCNLRITDPPLPDKILTDATEGFKGEVLICIFNHCFSRELADESKKLQPVLVPPVVQESPVPPVVQESPVPPVVQENPVPPVANPVPQTPVPPVA
ncbi:MAG: hypothetical protein WCL49_13510, partial [bacterium]